MHCILKLVGISLVILLSGCADKTKIEMPSKSTLSNKGLIIGSFSRDEGKAIFNEYSFRIYNSDKKIIKKIFNKGSQPPSIENMFHFEDDFKYETRHGSIFSFSLPKGEYYISIFMANYDLFGFYANKFKKIYVSNGEVTYIGDFKYEATSTKKGFLGETIGEGAKCTISNKLEKDFNVFNKYFKDTNIKKEDIKIDTIEKEIILDTKTQAKLRLMTVYY